MILHTTGKRLLATAIATIMLAGLASACASSVNETASMDSGAAVAPSTEYREELSTDDMLVQDEVAVGNTGESKTVSNSDRMVILTRTLQLEVESTTQTVEAIRRLTSEADGTITDLQIATDTNEWIYHYDEYGYTIGSGSALRGWITVRVPARSVDTFANNVMTLGTVTYQSEGSQDVTQEYIDLTARLENLEAEEARLREFFDAAKTVEDMLAIEAELSRVRGEIESLDARIKYLERQTALATVTIELTEEQPVVRPEGDTWGFTEAITNGFQGAADVLTFLITFLIASSPLWAAALLVLLVIYLVHRSRKKRRAARSANMPDDASANIDKTQTGV